MADMGILAPGRSGVGVVGVFRFYFQQTVRIRFPVLGLKLPGLRGNGKVIITAPVVVPSRFCPALWCAVPGHCGG